MSEELDRSMRMDTVTPTPAGVDSSTASKLPRPLRARVFAIVLVVAGHVACDIVGISLEAVSASPFELPRIFLIATLEAQVGVLAVWAALGTSSWFVRMSGPLLGLAAIVVGVASVKMANFEVLELAICLAPQAILVMLPLVIFRIQGWRLTVPQADLAKTVQSQWQFSIWHLLVVLAATGLLLGVGRTLRMVAPPSDLEMYGMILGVLVALAAITLTATWCSLGRTGLLVRLLLFSLTVPALGAAPPLVFEHVGPSVGEFALLGLIQGALIVATFLPLRLLGYQFVRSKRRG